jgi:DNA-binding GntR family transcriptional regulator
MKATSSARANTKAAATVSPPAPPAPPATPTPLNTPAYARLRERICADIITGIWPLGSHLTLQRLATHYGISHNPVREALFQLQGDGVVEIRNHRGAVLPVVDAAYIANVYDTRGAIERMLKSEAARRATPGQLRDIERAAREYEQAVAGGNAHTIVLLNRAFHRAIYAAAGNPVAVAMMESRSTLVDSVRAACGYGAGRLDAAICQHRGIVSAIRRRDAERAGTLAAQHTEASKHDLLERLAQRDANTNF